MTETMTGSAPQSYQKKTIPVFKAVIYLIVWLLVLGSAGMFVGNRFFWTNPVIRQAQNTVAHYRNLVQEEPDNPSYRVVLGYNHYLLKNYREAIEHLTAARTIDENYYDAYLNLGHVYSAMGYWDDALVNFETCVAIAPTDFQGHLNMGIAFRELGLYEPSMESLENALFLRSGSAEILYHLAMTAEKLGDTEQAITYLERALSYEPRYREALTLYNRLTR